MHCVGKDNFEAFTKTFKRLNFILEDKFDSFKNDDFRRSGEAKKIVHILSEPLLKIYDASDLDFGELTSLWKIYYSEVFDVRLNVCKNPFNPRKDFQFTQVTVMDALVSARIFFTNLKTLIEANDEKGKEESVGLLYNIFKYISSYKYQCTGSFYDENIKDFIVKTLRQFIEIIQIDSLSSDPSQPDQKPPLSQVIQEILNTTFDEVFGLIQKERSSEKSESNSLNKTENKFYYELAELLLHYATEDPCQSLQQKLIEVPIQKRLVKLGIENLNPSFSGLIQYQAKSTDQAFSKNFSLTVFDPREGRMVTLSSEIKPNALSINKFGVLVKFAPSAPSAPQNKCIDKAKWMEQIFDSIRSKTLAQIMIPGSHDAGTFNMSQFLLKPWSECQNKNFLEQLRSGIRYLDCRVGYRKNNSDEKFWFVHGACDSNTKLQELLDSVKKFLESTSKEIVILDFSHFGSRDPTWNDSYLLEFAQRFSSLRSYIAGRNFAKKTIEELISQNQRLVLLSDKDWPNSPCGRSINNSFWANTQNIKKLSDELNREVNKKDDYRKMTGQELHLTQAVLTPGLDIVSLTTQLPKSQPSNQSPEEFLKILLFWIFPLGGLISNVLNNATLQELAKMVTGWAPEVYNKPDWLKKVNVIFSDYVSDNPFVDIAIHANLNERK